MTTRDPAIAGSDPSGGTVAGKTHGKGRAARQRRSMFAREFLVDGNGAQAAIRAGFSAAGAKQRACELLAEPEVQAEVDDLTAERALRLSLTADDVLRRLAHLAEHAERDGDKIRALELLGKHLRLFTDKFEVAGGGLTLEDLVPPRKAQP